MTAQYQRDKEDAAERLLSLTVALLRGGQYGLKKDELQLAVREYRNQLEDWKPGNSAGKSFKTIQDAVTKKMERDLELLRESGIPVRVEIPTWAGADNTETRYFIAKDEFNWPEGIAFTERQIQLLQLANKVWSTAAIGATTNSSMSRIRALGPAKQVIDLAMIAPKLKIHHPSFMPLSAAAELGQLVSFGYRKPQSSIIERRTVQPWRLENIDGQWLLVAFDPSAGEEGDFRNFLLKRIIGNVETLKEKFTKPSQAQLDAALGRLEAHKAQNVAVIRAPKGSLASAHFDLEESDSEEIEFHYMDMYLLAEELRELGPELKVVRPKELEDEIRAGLERVASTHA